ncbi:hypothetical protein [Desulfovibrio sp.]
MSSPRGSTRLLLLGGLAYGVWEWLPRLSRLAERALRTWLP